VKKRPLNKGRTYFELRKAGGEQKTMYLGGFSQVSAKNESSLEKQGGTWVYPNVAGHRETKKGTHRKCATKKRVSEIRRKKFVRKLGVNACQAKKICKGGCGPPPPRRCRLGFCIEPNPLRRFKRGQANLKKHQQPATNPTPQNQ